MKIFFCVVLLLLVITQSLLVRSDVPQAEKRPIRGSPFVVKRFVPQAEKPSKRDHIWDYLFDAHAQAEADQDPCQWRCRDWCQKRCRDEDEECLDGCLNIYGSRWRRCIRKCENGDLDRPGGKERESEEEEEEEEE